MRYALAAALVAGAFAPVAASADPIPDPPPIHGYCEVYWLHLPVVVGDTTVTVPIPRMAC